MNVRLSGLVVGLATTLASLGIASAIHRCRGGAATRPGPPAAVSSCPTAGRSSRPAQQVPLADLPLNIIPLADNRHVLAATSGYNAHELTLIDLAEKKVVARQPVQQSWFGLAMARGTARIWWSGGGGDILHALQAGGRSTDPHRRARAGRSQDRTSRDRPHHFRSGIALDPNIGRSSTPSTSTAARSARWIPPA